MMGHGTIGIAAFLTTAAIGYLVCTKANAEKKGSNLRAVGLGLGALIIILSLLGSFYIVAKAKGCPMMAKKMWCNKMMGGGMSGVAGQDQASMPCAKK
jgi:hypothetical protein